MKFLILSSLFCLSICAKLPPNFIKCNRNQPDLEKCVLMAAQNALEQMNRPYKKLSIPSLEPLEVSELAIKSRLRLVRMDEKLTNCRFYQLTNVKLEKFDFDLNQKKIHINGCFPEVKSYCHYKINGTIIGAPIFGEGSSSLIFTGFNVTLQADFKEIKRNNKTYVQIYDCRVKGRPANVHFQLDNLFGNDKVASDQMNKIINDVWAELYDDVSDEYFRLADSLFTMLINRLFSRLSIEEAFD